MEVQLMSLWLPIVLSAVAVFFASSLVWMVVQYHNSDWSKLPDEEATRAALKGVAPGQYSVPYAASNEARKSAEWQEKCQQGPTAMLVVLPAGLPAMGKQLGQWFIYCLIISFLVAYVTSTTVPAGADYLLVFRIAGTVGVLAYAGAAAQGSIWFGHTWSRTVKDIIDGLIYGLLTAGVFGWLWP
ncbi:MAG: hypothetical protein ACR2PZ_11835 [Pseudomonadales bacterium]